MEKNRARILPKVSNKKWHVYKQIGTYYSYSQKPKDAAQAIREQKLSVPVSLLPMVF